MYLSNLSVSLRLTERRPELEADMPGRQGPIDLVCPCRQAAIQTLKEDCLAWDKVLDIRKQRFGIWMSG